MRYAVHLYETRYTTIEVEADGSVLAADEAVEEVLYAPDNDLNWSYGDIEVLDIEELEEYEDLPLDTTARGQTE